MSKQWLQTQSELREMELCETDKRVIPISGEELTIERRRPGRILPGAIQQVKMRNNLWDCVDYCFCICGKADSVNRPETCSCWNYCCWVYRVSCWVYRVSCWPAIVVNDRFYGIDLCTENRGVFTRELVLVGKPMTPYDVTLVYTKMNENFKGGINNVMISMIRNNDPADRRYLQRCADNGLRSSTHASVHGKPIREKGRFGYMDTPVRDADWSVEYSGGLSLVGDIRIGYLRDPVDRVTCIIHASSSLDHCAAGSAVSRILQGRDSRSVRFLVTDPRGLDQNFHDVKIVDMDDEREPMVTPADMKRLRELWPPAVFNHMKWFRQDLDLMQKSAKREYSQAM